MYVCVCVCKYISPPFLERKQNALFAENAGDRRAVRDLRAVRDMRAGTECYDFCSDPGFMS